MPATTAWRMVEREARVYSKLWRGSAFSTFIVPLFFLLAMGRGLGGLVDQHNRTVAGVSYLQFVTPGLLAGLAMQNAAPGALWNVMAGTKWSRFFFGIVATPLGPTDIYTGFVIWGAIRATMAAAGFTLIAALLGGVASPWGLLAIPAATLCAAAFIAPLVAFAATQTTDISFGILMRLVIVPLFLFSGTFFPVSQLPRWLHPAVRWSPLWHATELCRAFMTGRIHWSAVGVHVLVLCALVAAGAAWGTRTFARRLTQ